MAQEPHTTTITVNGAIYQQIEPRGSRFLSKFFGVIFVLLGLPLAIVILPVGLVFVALGVAMVVWLPKRIKPVHKFVSFSGQPCAGKHTFGNWNAKVHSGAAQIDRFEKAAHQPMAILSYNAQTGFAEIQGSGADSYMVSLDECTCPDFDKRSRPCKHIYFLAIQMGYSSDDFYNA